jgi:hypothetical protein
VSARRPYLLIAGWAAFTRLVVIATALAMHLAGGPHGLVGRTLHQPIGVLGTWDGVWYRIVAQRGYLLIPGHQSDPAFFPLYPILLRALHAVGLPYVAAGVLISNLVFVAAIVGFYELGRELLPEELAFRGALLAAAFPVGYVYSMMYPESVVLAALVLALLLALRGRWIASAVAGSIAALGRPEAAFLVIPVAALVYERWRRLPASEQGEALGAVVAPVASAATFPLYLSWTLHNVHAWNWAERGWGRSFKADGIVKAFTGLPSLIGQNHWLIRDVVFAVVYLVLLYVAWRVGIGLAWVVAGLLVFVLPLTSGSFVSDARFGLFALPAYWGLAALTRRRLALAAVLLFSLALLVGGMLSVPFTHP